MTGRLHPVLPPGRKPQPNRRTLPEPKRGRGCGPDRIDGTCPCLAFGVAVCSAPIDRLAEQSRRRQATSNSHAMLPSRRRNDAVSKTRQNCDRDRPDAARRTGNEYGPAGVIP